MKKDNLTLKSYFETGDYPTQFEFEDLIDSFLNIQEEDAVTGITDNGDGTYTFQLLSSPPVTIDVQSLPNEIPIAQITGLQAALDNLFYNGVDNDGKTLEFSAPTLNSGDPLLLVKSEGESQRWRVEHAGKCSTSNNDIYVRTGADGAGGEKVWHQGNDGSGSGLDADLLDGVDGSVYARLDQNVVFQNRVEMDILGFNTSGTGSANDFLTFMTDSNSLTVFNNSTGSSNFPGGFGQSLMVRGATNNRSFALWKANSDNADFYLGNYNGSLSDWQWNRIWHSGNDGSGSGLDADKLDGYSWGNVQGDISTSADVVSGRGSGGVAMTINDGYGNANLTFNHQNGTPEQNGNAARIEVNTDATSGAVFSFELKSNVSNGVAVGLTQVLLLTENGATFKDNVTADNFILSSDRSMKTEVTDVEECRLFVRWRNFELKRKKGKKRYGVIAQELEENHPEFVEQDEEGNLSVQYIDLLVAKMAEKDRQLETLEEKVKKLEQLVEMMV